MLFGAFPKICRFRIDYIEEFMWKNINLYAFSIADRSYAMCPRVHFTSANVNTSE